jgi:hypothetical protein
LQATTSIAKAGSRIAGKLFPKSATAKGVNRFGGVGKKAYGPDVPAKTEQLALGPGPAPTPAPSTVSSATSAGKSTAAPRAARIKINTKGGVGGKPYGPEVPPAPSTSTTGSSRLSEILRQGEAKGTGTKGTGTKKTGAKGTGTKGTGTKKDPDAPKLANSEADDAAYFAAQLKNRFPGATEKDLPFIQKLNRAQETIGKRGPGWESYGKWLKNPQTQATLARLRRK